ncbi:MAG: hypothetical protein COS99_08190 [Candidatus Omnitrophica bacterium CG07_land_8_20_14_0_80_42_15]|uniref:Response regulatory domain-containing protein n=1 Tax=Candidatus Aquitaenariimonas noxiae TaxID=1974741 RepID=A0A2J0KR49_9BACT|nr:MAG: hypothetical protein COS99_08190 [Candidatus Omnitrophica bacterium CG07_land_8_20_14_0_80_42_15]
MKVKILVIDDNEQDRKIITRFFTKANYGEIFTAESCKEGIERAESVNPDLVIIDTMLPDGEGFDVCRKIREKYGSAKPKIIVTTGSIDAIDAVKARKAGADDYCVKTSDCSCLLKAAKKFI